MDKEYIKDLVAREIEKDETIGSKVSQEIDIAYAEHSKTLSKSEDFVKATQEVIDSTAKARLRKDLLEALNEEHKNELSLYILEKEKAQLDYRREKEKGLIVEEVKAEIANKRIEVLKKRYGYLYKDGEPFIPSKSYNKNREFVNWYNSTSDNFKKFVKGTLKVLLYGSLGFLIVFLGYKGLSWIMQNVM